MSLSTLLCVGVASPLPSLSAPAIEAAAFVAAANGNAAKAERALRQKLAWADETAISCGRDIAPFLRSDGYVVAIEGCRARDGTPRE